jgi:formamidopyrimidine-DNA glycosylase
MLPYSHSNVYSYIEFMPELPEVETVKKGLIKNVIGKTLQDIQINTDKLRYPLNKVSFEFLKNKTIREIHRRGKHLIIFLEDDLQLIVHLGMSGVVKINPTDSYEKIKHDHIVITLNDNISIIYNDPRKFGYWLINTTSNPLEHKVLITHGVEPLTDDFNAKYLLTKLTKTSRKIKQTIMDNSIVVGVGNIYASEALFNSNILPTRPSNTITKKEVSKLVISIKEILEKAIAEGGTTLKDYKNTEGKPGYFTQQLNVYGRAKEKCYICETEIESLVIAQRNTFFCKKCQK